MVRLNQNANIQFIFGILKQLYIDYYLGCIHGKLSVPTDLQLCFFFQIQESKAALLRDIYFTIYIIDGLKTQTSPQKAGEYQNLL